MATRRRTQRARTQSSDVALGTGVSAGIVAPRGLTPAARNAQALSKALGFAAGAYDRTVQRNQTADFEAGTEAARRGEIDEATLRAQEQTEAFTIGAARVLARSRAIDDAATITEMYQTEFDKGAPVNDLNNWLNEKYAQLYEGVDPDIAREVVPHLQRTRESLLTAHAAGLAETTNSELVAAYSNAAPALFNNLTPEAWEAERTERFKMLGREAALETLANDLATHVARLGDERYLDNEVFDLIRQNPVVGPGLDKVYHDVRKARLANMVAEEQNARVLYYDEARALANAADPRAVEMILAGGIRGESGETPLTESEGQTLLGLYRDAAADGALTQISIDMYDRGVLGSFGFTNQTDYDEVFAAVTQHLESQGLTPEQIRAYHVDKIAMNGVVPSVVQNILRNARPENDATWPEAVQWYNDLYAQSPDTLARSITDETQDTFEAYNSLVEVHGDEEARRRMADFNPALAQQILGGARREFIDDAVADAVEKEWSLSTAEITPGLRQVADRYFNTGVGMGMTPEQAAEFAVTRMDQKYANEDGQLWERNMFLGEEPGDVLDYIRTATGSELGLDAGDIQVTSMPSRPGYVLVGEVNSFAPVQVRVRDMVNGFRSVRAGQRAIAAEQARVEARDELIDQAKERLVPAAGTRMDDTRYRLQVERLQDEAWDNLTTVQQTELLRQIDAEERAEAAAAERLNAERGAETLRRLQERNLGAL